MEDDIVKTCFTQCPKTYNVTNYFNTYVKIHFNARTMKYMCCFSSVKFIEMDAYKEVGQYNNIISLVRFETMILSFGNCIL